MSALKEKKGVNMELSFTQSYNDLCQEIDALEIRMFDLETERKFLQKNMYANAPKYNGVVDYAKDNVMGGPVALSLDKILERMNRIDDNLNTLSQVLNAKKDAKRRIEQMINSLDGLEYKVAYMRDIEGLRLHEIAGKLGYSYDHVRRISSKMRKMPQRCHKNPVKS
jgi:DNA-directed RNA polymerase specialized sigma subunit